VRRMVAAVAMAGLVVGCATGGRGARIREIQEYDTGECRFLGTVESTERSGWDMSDDQLGAMALVRKRATAMGGNAYMVIRGEASAVGVVVRANVYRCP
jgi:hypothetical protein